MVETRRSTTHRGSGTTPCGGRRLRTKTTSALRVLREPFGSLPALCPAPRSWGEGRDGKDLGSSEAWHCARTWRCIRLYALAIKVEHTMLTNLKIRGVLVVLACIAIGCMTGSASAVTAQIAKKCQALTAKAFPPRVPGNPAAGSAKGTGQSQRDYFNKCVANGGKMDDDAPKQTK